MRKKNRYQSVYTKKKPTSNVLTYKVVLLIALSVMFILIIYSDKFKDSIETDLRANGTAKPAQILNIITKESHKTPAITLSVDGINYSIEANGDLTTSSSQALYDAIIPVGKNSKLDISFDDKPESFNMILYKDNTVVLSGQSTSLESDDFPGDGEYRCVCKASWSSIDSKKETFYQFMINADFPYELAISSSEIDPGELLVITAENLNPDEAMIVETDLDFMPKIFQYENKRIVMLPVSYNNEPGKIYQIKLLVNDEINSYAVKLNDKDFTTQYMTIDTKIAAETRNDKSAQEVVDKINPLKPLSDDEPYWNGNFLMPVEGGRVTETDFGKRRYVNNSPTSYRHNGLDIGHNKGVPVMASNNGRILIADYLIGTGNTVVIEHGFGLKTWYYHMDELSVKTDDMVEKGRIIGKVGSTGFSTGPHLHFSASVNNVFINSITIINHGVPLFEQE